MKDYLNLYYSRQFWTLIFASEVMTIINVGQYRRCPHHLTYSAQKLQVGMPVGVSVIRTGRKSLCRFDMTESKTGIYATSEFFTCRKTFTYNIKFFVSSLGWRITLRCKIFFYSFLSLTRGENVSAFLGIQWFESHKIHHFSSLFMVFLIWIT